MSKPKLRKSNLNLKQFDGSAIKTLGSFEGIWDKIPLWDYSHHCSTMQKKKKKKKNKKNRHLIRDILKVDTEKLINCIKSEGPDMGDLKEYKASIHVTKKTFCISKNT